MGWDREGWKWDRMDRMVMKWDGDETRWRWDRMEIKWNGDEVG